LITSSRVLFSKFDMQEIIRAIIRCSIKHGMNSIGFLLIHLFFKRRTTHCHAGHEDDGEGRQENEIGGELAAELARK